MLSVEENNRPRFGYREMSKKLTVFDMVNPTNEIQSIQDDPGCSRTEDDDVNAGSSAIEQLDREPSYPVKIHADSRSEVWYKSDRKLGLPKSYAFIQYISPLPSASAENAVMQELLVHILQNSPSDKLKGLTNAEGINYKVHDAYKGVVVEVNSLNQKLPRPLESITECIANCTCLTMRDLFHDSKKELLKHYSTWLFETDQLSVELTISLLNPGFWNVLDRYEAISNIEFSEFGRYIHNFAESVYIRSFVQGNVTEIDAIQTVEKCVQILNSEVRPSNAFSILPETVIPRGEHCFRVQSFYPFDAIQSRTTNYYQFEDASPKTAVMINAFDRIIFVDRSKAAHLKMMNIVDFSEDWDLVLITDWTGYYIRASGSGDTTVADLDSKIEKSRKRWNYRFRNLTDDDSLSLKEYAMSEMAKELLVAGSKEEVSANWNEIFVEKYIFNRQAQQLNILREIRIEEFRAWMVNLTMAKSDRRFRKLTIQVAGYNEAWEDRWTRHWIRSVERLESGHSNIDELSFSLKYLTYLTDKEPRRSTSYFIEDIESYRVRLKAFPNYGSDIEQI